MQDGGHELIAALLDSFDPELRAAAVFALGCLICTSRVNLEVEVNESGATRLNDANVKQDIVLDLLLKVSTSYWYVCSIIMLH